MTTQLTQEQTREFLVRELAKLVKVNPADIDTNVAFDRYGLDSAAAVEFTGLIGQRVGRELEPTLLYDHPTIDALNTFLTRMLAGKAA